MSKIFEENLNAIGTIEDIADKAKDAIDLQFEKLLDNGKLDLMVNPEMLRHGELKWVRNAILAHQTPPPGLEYKDLIAILDANSLPERLREPDAKATIALINDTRIGLNKRFEYLVSGALKNIKLECDLIREAHHKLDIHTDKIMQAMTLGLDPKTEYTHEWIGAYGATRTPENTPEVSPWNVGAYRR